jgi:hypothetical protein
MRRQSAFNCERFIAEFTLELPGLGMRSFVVLKLFFRHETLIAAGKRAWEGFVASVTMDVAHEFWLVGEIYRDQVRYSTHSRCGSDIFTTTLPMAPVGAVLASMVVFDVVI